METLPNGLRVFNATPHVIRFWREGWDEPVEVETDEIVSATPHEEDAGWLRRNDDERPPCVAFVRTRFVGTDAGREIIVRAKSQGADVIVGSIIAAQAYPGEVVAMTPAPGYERVPPAEKRMNLDKFTVF